MDEGVGLKPTGLETARIIWMALLLGQVFMAVLGLCFIRVPDTRPSLVILGVLGYLGVILLATSYHFRFDCPGMRKPKGRAAGGGERGGWTSGRQVPPHLVLGPACAEAVLFLGLVIRALGYSVAVTMVFAVASFVGVVLEYPRPRDFAAMLGDGHVA